MKGGQYQENALVFRMKLCRGRILMFELHLGYHDHEPTTSSKNTAIQQQPPSGLHSSVQAMPPTRIAPDDLREQPEHVSQNRPLEVIAHFQIGLTV